MSKNRRDWMHPVAKKDSGVDTVEPIRFHDVALTEGDLKKKVKDKLKELGFTYYTAFPPTRLFPAGWPDIFVLGHGVSFWIEFKGFGGSVSTVQQNVFNLFNSCRQHVYIVSNYDQFKEVMGKVGLGYMMLDTWTGGEK